MPDKKRVPANRDSKFTARAMDFVRKHMNTKPLRDAPHSGAGPQRDAKLAEAEARAMGKRK